jgi:hypothetical protein
VGRDIEFEESDNEPMHQPKPKMRAREHMEKDMDSSDADATATRKAKWKQDHTSRARVIPECGSPRASPCP